ncbi:MAG: endonuclease MutS2, partial [Tannerella sp.]|nr:endonuclease MutS2 [Tannerella sp.]
MFPFLQEKQLEAFDVIEIYPEHFESKIGFDGIRRLIGDKCLSLPGKERVEAMSFSVSETVISTQLEQTDEFMRILRSGCEFPSGHFTDMRPSLLRIRPEGTYLEEQELFDLLRSLQTVQRIVHFFHAARADDETPCPTLTTLADHAPVFPAIIRQTEAILDKYGRIKDQASPELTRIRREITATVG